MNTLTNSSASTLTLMNILKGNSSFEDIKSFIDSHSSQIDWQNVCWINFALSSQLSCLPEFADYLIEKNYCSASRLHTDESTLLHCICDNTYAQDFCDVLEFIYVLLKHGAPIDKVDSRGNTPLANALTTSKNPGLIIYLLDNGANPNLLALEKSTQTYLEYCLDNLFMFYYHRSQMKKINIHYPIIELLLSHGASLINPKTGVPALTFLNESAGRQKINGASAHMNIEVLNKTIELLSAYENKRNLEQLLPVVSSPASPSKKI